MMARHWRQQRFTGDGIVQIHSATTRQQENFLDTFLSHPFYDVVGDPDFLSLHVYQPIQ
jgi:hypothetical protein